MTPQQLQEFNRLYEKYIALNMSEEEASRKAIRDMTQKGLLKPQGVRKPVPKISHFGQTSRLMKEDWFQQLKATGTVTSSSAAGGGPSDSATTEGISFFDSQGNPSLRFRKRRKKHGKKDDEKRGC
tara:strand:+ start:1765 stop:2142 length:378 start_codon:yes stop_codon:yes gene_type:complete